MSVAVNDIKVGAGTRSLGSRGLGMSTFKIFLSLRKKLLELGFFVLFSEEGRSQVADLSMRVTEQALGSLGFQFHVA